MSGATAPSTTAPSGGASGPSRPPSGGPPAGSAPAATPAAPAARPAAAAAARDAISRLPVGRSQPAGAPAPAAAANGADSAAPAAGDRGDGRDAAGRYAPRGEEDGAPPGQAAPAPAVPPTRHKLKVNGEEREAPDDLNELLNLPGLSEGQRIAMLRHAQRAMAADERFHSSSQLNDQVQGLFRAFREDRLGALEKLLTHEQIGIDPGELIQEYMARQFEREQMTPEARELHDMKAEVSRLKKAEEQRAEAQAKARQDQFRRQVAEQMQADIIGALEDPASSRGLPKTAEIAQRIRSYLEHDLRMRMKMDRADPRRAVALRAAEVIPLVREDLMRDTRALASGLDAKDLRELLGDDAAKKLREEAVAAFESGGPTVTPTPAGYAPPPRADGGPRPRMSEVRQRILQEIRKR